MLEPAIIESRSHKGNAAVLHDLFANKEADLEKLFNAGAGDAEAMELALAEKHIYLEPAQYAALAAAANKDAFFTELLKIQQAEIETYLKGQTQKPPLPAGATQTEPYESKTANYYHTVLELMKKNPPAEPSDYFKLLNDHQRDKDDKKQTQGKLLTAMNREHEIYLHNEADQTFGSKAQNVGYLFRQKRIDELGGAAAVNAGPYKAYQDYVDQHESTFPGGFHVKIDTNYRKKTTLSSVKDAKKPGGGVHFTVVNIKIPGGKEALADIINDRKATMPNGEHCYVHDIQFEINGKTYGIMQEYKGPGQPLIMYKIEIDPKTNQAVAGARKSLVSADECNNVDGTMTMVGRYAKCKNLSEAFPLSLKNTQQAMLKQPISTPTPILTTNPAVPPLTIKGTPPGGGSAPNPTTPAGVVRVGRTPAELSGAASLNIHRGGPVGSSGVTNGVQIHRGGAVPSAPNTGAGTATLSVGDVSDVKSKMTAGTQTNKKKPSTNTLRFGGPSSSSND